MKKEVDESSESTERQVVVVAGPADDECSKSGSLVVVEDGGVGLGAVFPKTVVADHAPSMILSSSSQESEAPNSNILSIENPIFDMETYRKKRARASQTLEFPSSTNGLEGMLSFAIDVAEQAADKISPETIASLIGVMLAHPTDAALQTTGCRILRFLSRHKPHKVTIRDSEGIEATLCAMASHPNEAVLQARACGILGNVAIDPTGKYVIAYLGGINSIVVGMRSHPDDADVQDAACKALGNLSACCINNAGIILSSGGARAVVQAMRNHEGVFEVQLSATRTLINLCRKSQHVNRRLIEMGAIDTVERAIVAFEDSYVEYFGKRVVTKLRSTLW